MKKLSAKEIREIWLNFFKNKKHHKISSASLVPYQDPSVLWINAGITPLKKYFDGTKKPLFTKIVNIQKCLRTNDIDNVGKTDIHHTFFEMLGNFSIGDYFKKEAIDLSYELLTSQSFFCIDPKKLYITYFEQDSETYHLWIQKGINFQNLIPLKNNFWEIGEGPCGPCTEIFFDRGEQYDHRGKELIKKNIPNNRFIEIWNIVFSQYNAKINVERSHYQELISKNIDTGAGLERLACIFQQTKTNFETDLFLPIIKKIALISHINYQNQESFKIISDHVKSLVFGINDGVILDNNGRGYVLKRILRKALLQGHFLGLQKPFLYKLVSNVVDIYKSFYHFTISKIDFIEKIIKSEEEKFFINLKMGETYFFQLIQNNNISGENFFKLYDTYGIPREIILEYAKKNKIQINLKEFEIFLEKQKTLSRSQIDKTKYNIQKKNNIFFNFQEKSEFVGYQNFEIKTKVIKICDQAIILKKTPFYATMGGQIGDKGWINDIPVLEVTKLPNGQHLHHLQKNIFSEGQEIFAKIDLEKRKQISLNHTATHLLYDAMKITLGEHVKQKGSYLNEKFLRFDFNHYENINEEQLLKIENQVNSWIEKKYPIITKNMNFEKAQKINAHFLDDNHYPEQVRVIQIGDNISLQICGGTHANNTKKLKKFAIISYNLIGSGIHRIEATTDQNIDFALKQKIELFIEEENNIINKINQLKNNNDFIIEDFSSIRNNSFNSYQNILDYKKQLQHLRKKSEIIQKEIIQKQSQIILKKANLFIPIKIEKNLLITIKEEIPINIRKILLEHLFNKLKTDFLCLCFEQKTKFNFLCKSKTIDVSCFINEIKKIIDIKGGGNKNFGQGNCSDINKIHKFLENWKSCIL
ncbi:alanine--tRNA ligase [Candidatus Phytoplasma pini]|uniref:Alanine--tRNA ligase n=1 Tax=Candidatus Phytoplasma pini TaxID=267362 RepID=A0A559KJ81_9MOLU|nr:alanine--tRNA ligase [Candidatus Phytoplasma pini]TVY12195.1 Alanyl-tRNA synthetase [Candidatus Phytoplasma pini]